MGGGGWFNLGQTVTTVTMQQDYQLECIQDELSRLSFFESENKRKDVVISTLRKEIAEYKKCTQSRDIR